jgi:DNA-binding LacI/PurR family transcriptional regulator
VARAVGVDRTVAGRVLLGTGLNIRVHPDTEKKIRAAAKRLNYQPNQMARQLKGIRSHLLGAMVTPRMNYASYERLLAVERAALERGYRVMVGQATADMTSSIAYLADLQGRGVEAILCLDAMPVEIESLLASTPNIFYTLAPEHRKSYCVGLDRVASSVLAVEHLVERGRRRVGLVMANLISRTARDRHRGYQKALASLLNVDDDRYVFIAPPNFTLEQSADAAVEILVTRGRCDGLAAGNDLWAAVLIKALRKRGLSVPSDVSVVGHDNSDVAIACDPELTTIDHRHDELAAKLIDMALDPPKRPCQTLITPKLIVRNST